MSLNVNPPERGRGWGDHVSQSSLATVSRLRIHAVRFGLWRIHRAMHPPSRKRHASDPISLTYLPRCRFLLHWWTQAKCPRATKAMPFAFKGPTAPRSTLDNLHYYRSFRPVDIRFYVQYEHNAKRSGVQSFISSVTKAASTNVMR